MNAYPFHGSIKGWTLVGHKLRSGAHGRTEIAFRDIDRNRQNPCVIKRFSNHGRTHDAAWRSAANERDALDRVNDPRIIRVVDHGRDSNGVPFIAMPYQRRGHFTTESLAPLPFHRVLALMADLLSTFVYLHGLGITHGDVAACNALLTEDDGVILIDFACATIRAQADDAVDTWVRAVDTDLQRLAVLCRWLSRQGTKSMMPREIDLRRVLDEQFGSRVLAGNILTQPDLIELCRDRSAQLAAA